MSIIKSVEVIRLPRACSNEEIKRLQDNLSIIRNAGGWSSETFGDMIGVTKQTISNLEKNTIAMSKTQYIAIRAVLDYEIEQRKNDETDCLESTVNLCLNSKGIPSEKMANAQAYLRGTRGTSMKRKAMIGALAALVGATAIATLNKSSSNDWLGGIINNEKKK